MKAARLVQFIDGRNNNFNLIRFIAASMVIYGHCYPLTGRPKLTTQFGYDSGSIAVDVFFITSGFLVTGSLLSRYDLKFFSWSRVLRIFPALFINLIFCICVIGPFFTTLTLQDYFLHRQVFNFFFKNLFMFFGNEGGLPGVFEKNHYETYVNGSLWTLQYEVKMYASIAILGLLCIYIKSNLFLKSFVVVSTIVSSVLMSIILFKFLKHHDPTYIDPHFRLGSMFFVGVYFYTQRSKVILSTTLFLVCIGVLIFFALLTNLLFIPYILLIGYIVFYLAYVPKYFLKKISHVPDYSYGLYIYSFPIQQSISLLYPSIDIPEMFLVSFSSTLVLAALSWHFVEKPALRMKKLFYVFPK